MKHFSARETHLLRELDGLELAGFWPRAAALLVDGVLMCFFYSVAATLGLKAWEEVRRLQGKSAAYQLPGIEKDVRPPLIIHGTLKVHLLNVEANETLHILSTVIVPVLYFGILLWAGKGQTPGKRLLKIRVVSLTHPHITFWHSVERALGYGAAALELGFGFVQFFIHPYRRCSQDRLAETIVVNDRSFQALQRRRPHPPAVHDAAPPATPDAAGSSSVPSST